MLGGCRLDRNCRWNPRRAERGFHRRHDLVVWSLRSERAGEQPDGRRKNRCGFHQLRRDLGGRAMVLGPKCRRLEEQSRDPGRGRRDGASRRREGAARWRDWRCSRLGLSGLRHCTRRPGLLLGQHRPRWTRCQRRWRQPGRVRLHPATTGTGPERCSRNPGWHGPHVRASAERRGFVLGTERARRTWRRHESTAARPYASRRTL